MAVVIPIIADIKGLTSGVGDAEKQLDRLGKNVGKAGSSMTKGFTLPIVALGAASVIAFDQVDSAMDEVAAKTGATGPKLDALQATFKRVAANATQGMDQVAIAVAGVSQRLGLTGKPLEDMSQRMLTFARVTGVDVEAATTGVTRAMGAMNIQSRDGAGFMDLLLKASQATGIKVDVLTDKLVKFGPAMQKLGFDTTTTVALMGQFEKAGINTDAALGGLKKNLGILAKSGETDLPKALEFSINSIKKAGTTSEATKLAMGMFGAKAGPELAIAIRKGTLSVDDLAKTLRGSKGALDSTAAATEGPQEKMARLKNQLTLVAAAFGDILVPVLAQVIVPLQGLASALQNLSPQMRQIVVIILATVAAIGPMLIVTSKIIGVFQQLKEAVMVLRAGMALLNITLLMNPFVLIAVAVIALIAGLVLLYQHSETFRNIVDQISAVVKENLVVAFNWLKLKIDEIWPVIQNMYEKAKPVLEFLGAAVELYVVTYIKLVKFYIEAWVFVIKTAYELMKPIVMFIGGIIKDYIVAEIQAVKTAIGLATDAFDGIKTAIIIVKDAIKGPLNTIKESITTAINGAVDAVSTSIKGITGIFKTVVSGIQEIWNSTLGGKHFGFPSWLPGIGGNGFTIPMLAAGGIVSSPTLAMIGEAGPEAVVPLNHSTTSLGATYYLTINAGMGTSGASVGRDIVEAIKVFERRNGAVFQAA